MGIANERLSYEAQTQKSKQHMERAKRVMPGGMTANIKHYAPYPITIQRANGCRLYDLDGHEYIDFLMGYGALMLGHGHPQVKKAIENQLLQDGTWLFGTPHNKEAAFAERLQHYFPSVERVRYTNSGTEANLLALRLAMAYTNKYKVAKFEGHYHGAIDSLLVSVSPTESEAGAHTSPLSVADSGGMNHERLVDTIVLPFNDPVSCEQILTEHKDELGAVIIEPIEGGIIEPHHEFIKKLREVTNRLGIVLIFDEVKTAFRSSMGGAQAVYGITPDITTMGKVIGGGFPFGVVGGKAEIMELSSPLSGFDFFADQHADRSSKALFHSGTYNGHPMILAAGLATLDVLDEQYNSLLKRTETFKQALCQLFASYNIPAQTVGRGAMFSVLFTDVEDIANYRSLKHLNTAFRNDLDRALFSEGVYVKPGNRYSMSVVHDDDALQQALEAYERVLPTIMDR
ncbi:aspartate aminotransferase family protein [Geomicrobium sp. JSM 1781026]|uniref:aspartate aminotransferase family protein n=1 Tax=Geomicrobium sp. JSM 1781026 TaxID=3344580 RepID=UPI0035C254DD